MSAVLSVVMMRLTSD